MAFPPSQPRFGILFHGRRAREANGTISPSNATISPSNGTISPSSVLGAQKRIYTPYTLNLKPAPKPYTLNAEPRVLNPSRKRSWQVERLDQLRAAVAEVDALESLDASQRITQARLFLIACLHAFSSTPLA